MATDEFIQHLWEIGPAFTEATPHSKKLGIKFVAVDKGRATMSLPYNPDLIGDPRFTRRGRDNIIGSSLRPCCDCRI